MTKEQLISAVLEHTQESQSVLRAMSKAELEGYLAQLKQSAKDDADDRGETGVWGMISE